MKPLLTCIAIVAALAFAPRRALAHGEPIIVTEENGVLTTNGNVFSTEFEPIASLTYTDIPGFEFIGFEAGDVIRFDVVDHFWYWNSTEGVTSAPEELELRIEGKSAPFPWRGVQQDPLHVEGENVYVHGFAFETIDAQSTQHQHLLAYLFEEPQIPMGAYAIVMRINSPEYGYTDPFVIAFNQNLGGTVFRDAILELSEAALAEPYPPGDFNKDRAVDALDIDLLYANLGGIDVLTYDITGDASIDDLDVAQWVHEIVGTEFGDANLDLAVDLADLNAVRNKFGDVGGWAAGDTDGSGQIDLADLNNVRNHFGFAGGAVPEPASLALCAVALASLALRLRTGSRG